MKYIAEFRDPSAAKAVAKQIHEAVNQDTHYRLMEFCGGHTHAIHRYGLTDLLPKNVELLHGPGCPVCVLPIAKIDQAIDLARREGVIFCSYGDMLRVPGGRRMSLMRARAEGADVRMVYSVDDALRIAEENPNNQVVFFAIGFETTTPPTAAAIVLAQEMDLRNFSVFCNHVLTPVALQALLEPDDGRVPNIDGFIGPAHVSTIIGSDAYVPCVERFHKPIVIAGFEPIDVLHSIWMLIRQINLGVARVENQYTRAVLSGGNVIAKQAVGDVFCLRDSFEWRGLGWIPHSALQIRDEFAAYDAEKRFVLTSSNAREQKGCECASVLRGLVKPHECKLFGAACTPSNPLGSCMVSSEGACAAYFSYRGQARAMVVE